MGEVGGDPKAKPSQVRSNSPLVAFTNPYYRAHLKVVGWLGRISANHFQRHSNQKMSGKPLKNKGKPRNSQERQSPPTPKMLAALAANHSYDELCLLDLISLYAPMADNDNLVILEVWQGQTFFVCVLGCVCVICTIWSHDW